MCFTSYWRPFGDHSKVVLLRLELASRAVKPWDLRYLYLHDIGMVLASATHLPRLPGYPLGAVGYRKTFQALITALTTRSPLHFLGGSLSSHAGAVICLSPS